jgi:hypothetical protein
MLQGLSYCSSKAAGVADLAASGHHTAVVEESCCCCCVCAPQDAFSGTGMAPPATLPPKLMAAATRQWMFSNRRSPGWRPSRLQASVAGVLSNGLGLAVQQEAITEDGLFSIDVAVQWKGRCAVHFIVCSACVVVSSYCGCDA